MLEKSPGTNWQGTFFGEQKPMFRLVQIEYNFIIDEYDARHIYQLTSFTYVDWPGQVASLASRVDERRIPLRCVC